jgi:hypothetical protein
MYEASFLGWWREGFKRIIFHSGFGYLLKQWRFERFIPHHSPSLADIAVSVLQPRRETRGEMERDSINARSHDLVQQGSYLSGIDLYL